MGRTPKPRTHPAKSQHHHLPTKIENLQGGGDGPGAAGQGAVRGDGAQELRPGQCVVYVCCIDMDVNGYVYCSAVMRDWADEGWLDIETTPAQHSNPSLTHITTNPHANTHRSTRGTTGRS